jgi:osmotically inducible protein OsmC
MSISRATAQWTGRLKDGRGMMKPAHAAEVPFSVASRFEGAPSSNPEEMIGAALAGCFSMALTLSLEQAGVVPESVDTSAEVTLERQAGGFTITGIALTTRAKVPGLDAERFAVIAEATKQACPVSKALAATPITLAASLA